MSTITITFRHNIQDSHQLLRSECSHSPSSKIHILKNVQCGGTTRWELWAVIRPQGQNLLQMTFNALKKEISESSLASVCHVKTQQVCDPEENHLTTPAP